MFYKDTSIWHGSVPLGGGGGVASADGLITHLVEFTLLELAHTFLLGSVVQVRAGCLSNSGMWRNVCDFLRVLCCLKFNPYLSCIYFLSQSELC